MPDLLSVLDAVAAGLTEDQPEMSEAEVVVATVRLNLTVLCQTLAQIGVTGDGLDNEQLYGITSGLVETVQWMAGKEMLAATLSDIDEEFRQ